MEREWTGKGELGNTGRIQVGQTMLRSGMEDRKKEKARGGGAAGEEGETFEQDLIMIEAQSSLKREDKYRTQTGHGYSQVSEQKDRPRNKDREKARRKK